MYFVFISVAIIGSSVALQLNKCCPIDQCYNLIDDILTCVSFNESLPQNYWLPESFNETLFVNLTINYNSVPCHQDDADMKTSFELRQKGNSVIVDDGQIILSEEYFCVEMLSDEININFVFECPCSEGFCLHKCCPENEHLHLETMNHAAECKESGNETDWNFDCIDKTIAEKYLTKHINLDCIAMNKSSKFLDEYIEIREDGSIFSEVYGTIQKNEYCGDYFQKGDGPKKSTVIACSKDVKVTLESKIYGYVSLLSVFFLFVVAFLHFWLPEIGGSPKWSMAIQATCLFVAYSCYAYQQLSPSLFGRVFCIFCGFLLQFSFLASFFWLNVMCVDIAWTFSGIQGSSDHQRSKEDKKFVWYSVYAWSGSLLLTLAAIVAEFSPLLHQKSRFKPKIATVRCYFKDAESFWVFVYGPIGLLLLTNLILFTYTTYKIIMLKRGTEALRHDSNSKNNKKRQQRFILYLKIFFVMGVSWLTEVISWSFHRENGLRYVWYTTDAINVLRIIYMFKFLCCRRKVWVAINKKAPWTVRLEELFLETCCNRKMVIQGDFNTNSTSINRREPDHGKSLTHNSGNEPDCVKENL